MDQQKGSLTAANVVLPVPYPEKDGFYQKESKLKFEFDSEPCSAVNFNDKQAATGMVAACL